MTQMPVRGRKHLNRKSKEAIALKVKVPEDIEVQCCGKWRQLRLPLFFREGPSTALLAAMQGEFARLPGNMANAISKAFESAKADLEIS